MSRDVDDADILVGKHHGILLSAGEGGIDFRVAVVVMAGKIESLLVQRGGDSAVDIAVHGQFDSLANILEGGIATLRLHLAETERRQVDAVQVEDIYCSVFKTGVTDIGDGIYLKRKAKQ